MPRPFQQLDEFPRVVAFVRAQRCTRPQVRVHQFQRVSMPIGKPLRFSIGALAS
jgi:hypothetical protein